MLLLLALLFQYADGFHTIPLEELATTRWPHVCVSGPVTYVRKQSDGDYHITLDNGKGKGVLEIIPQIPLEIPRKGDIIMVCGISRFDRHHNWGEVHPVTSIAFVKRRK